MMATAARPCGLACLRRPALVLLYVVLLCCVVLAAAQGGGGALSAPPDAAAEAAQGREWPEDPALMDVLDAIRAGRGEASAEQIEELAMVLGMSAEQVREMASRPAPPPRPPSPPPPPRVEYALALQYFDSDSCTAAVSTSVLHRNDRSLPENVNVPSDASSSQEVLFYAIMPEVLPNEADGWCAGVQRDAPVTKADACNVGKGDKSWRIVCFVPDDLPADAAETGLAPLLELQRADPVVFPMLGLPFEEIMAPRPAPVPRPPPPIFAVALTYFDGTSCSTRDTSRVLFLSGEYSFVNGDIPMTNPDVLLVMESISSICGEVTPEMREPYPLINTCGSAANVTRHYEMTCFLPADDESREVVGLTPLTEELPETDPRWVERIMRTMHRGDGKDVDGGDAPVPRPAVDPKEEAKDIDGDGAITRYDVYCGETCDSRKWPEANTAIAQLCRAGPRGRKLLELACPEPTSCEELTGYLGHPCMKQCSATDLAPVNDYRAKLGCPGPNVTVADFQEAQRARQGVVGAPGPGEAEAAGQAETTTTITTTTAAASVGAPVPTASAPAAVLLFIPSVAFLAGTLCV